MKVARMWGGIICMAGPLPDDDIDPFWVNFLPFRGKEFADMIVVGVVLVVVVL